MIARRPIAAAAAAVLALALGGCLMGPNYQRPTVVAPPAYRNAPAAAPAAPATPSFGDEKWFDLFQDPVLRQLVSTALQRNYDLRIAASRILEAQEEAGIVRASEFPFASAGANGVDARSPKINKVFPTYSSQYGALNISVLWNLDFWGRYRRATEAARDQLLAQQWAQRAVMSSLVAQVAESYFQMRELDDELAIAQKTLAARQNAYRLTQVLEQNGSASQLDLAQSRELVDTAAATVPGLERDIAQQEDLLSTLLGDNPHAIPRGAPLDAQPNPPAVPAGLPSTLLERRPDIREAEAQLMAANAEIGVARAAMFPSISLTADAGLESFALNQLFHSSAHQWNITPSLTQPIFAAGSLHAAVRYTEDQKQQMLLAYQQSIQEAFREVSDALVALNKDHAVRQQQQDLAQAAAQAETLAHQLYTNGGGSFLQVLVAQTNAFAADLQLSQAQLNERLALVQLYNALGGGWQ